MTKDTFLLKSKPVLCVLPSHQSLVLKVQIVSSLALESLLKFPSFFFFLKFGVTENSPTGLGGWQRLGHELTTVVWDPAFPLVCRSSVLGRCWSSESSELVTSTRYREYHHLSYSFHDVKKVGRLAYRTRQLLPSSLLWLNQHFRILKYSWWGKRKVN